MKNSGNRNNGFMKRTNALKTQIQEGSYYIVTVWNRCLDRESISRFRFDSYKDLNEKYYFV